MKQDPNIPTVNCGVRLLVLKRWGAPLCLNGSTADRSSRTPHTLPHGDPQGGWGAGDARPHARGLRDYDPLPRAQETHRQRSAAPRPLFSPPRLSTPPSPCFSPRRSFTFFSCFIVSNICIDIQRGLSTISHSPHNAHLSKENLGRTQVRQCNV